MVFVYVFQRNSGDTACVGCVGAEQVCASEPRRGHSAVLGCIAHFWLDSAGLYYSCFHDSRPLATVFYTWTEFEGRFGKHADPTEINRRNQIIIIIIKKTKEDTANHKYTQAQRSPNIYQIFTSLRVAAKAYQAGKKSCPR